MHFNKVLTLFAFLLLITGCVNSPEHYKSAGFDSWGEAKGYIPHYLYFANKISQEEWDLFYKRFPEYWKDMQFAKSIPSLVVYEYNPTYTAYSFKWNTNRRKNNWDNETLERLNNKKLLKGDSIYKVIYSQGVPDRVIWDNDFEILIYKTGSSLIFMNGVFDKEKVCKGCFEDYLEYTESGMTDNDVAEKLGLIRPQYQ